MTKAADLNKRLFSKRFHPAFRVVVLTLLVAGMLVFSARMGVRLAERHAPLVDAAMGVKLELALAHRSLAAASGRDSQEAITEVWAHLDEAQWYATAMLEGGENAEGVFAPLHEPELCREMEEVRAKIADFREHVEEWYTTALQSGVGSEAARRHEVVFEAIMHQADAVKIALQAAMAKELRQFKAVQGLLIVLCLGLGGVVGSLLHAYEKKKRAHLKALQKSEGRYHDLFNTGRDGYVIVLGNGTILDANPRMLEMLGYSASELKTKSFWDITPEKWIAQERKKQGTLLFERGYTELYEKEYIRKDGTVFPIEVQAFILEKGEDFGSSKIGGFARDITERKRTEEEAARERLLINALMDNIPDRIYFKDAEGRFLRANRALSDLFGVDSPAELVGKTDFDFHPEKNAKQNQADEAEILRTGQALIAKEMRRTQHDGSEKWDSTTKMPLYDEDGRIIGTFGITRDITEHRRAEEERLLLMQAIEQAAESIVITDAGETIQYVNPAFERITGYTRDEAVGQTPRILKSGEHDDTFYKKMWDTLLSGETWRGRFVNRKKDGSLYTEEAVISPVHDDEGRPVSYVAVRRDITNELELEKQFRQSQKMDSLGQLVGGVAHDFNNLLQVITGFTDIAQQDLKPKHPSAASLKEVAKAGKQATDLVRQLLAFSRQQVIDPVYLNPNEVVEKSQKMLRRLIGEHIQFKFIAGSETGTIFTDRGQMQQMLMNLCVNARDAMPNGGTLTIETKNALAAPKNGKPQAWDWPGRCVLLKIHDTGCGMDKKTCDRIFEPFFTTKERGKGTGLGLSTVYGIVKQNNGYIDVCSKPGKGTTFKIYLPVSEPSSVKAENLIPDLAGGGSETVLVVEDDETLLGLATHILSHAGYTVLTAKDGKDGLRVFEKHTDEIDLIMTDVVMPHLGAKEMMDQILEQHPGLRHLFVSAYSPNAGHTEFIKEKGAFLLAKPYTIEELLRKIREVLDAE